MSSLGHFYTPKCPKTPPISHQDVPQIHRDHPRLQRDRGRHPPRLHQGIILSFGISQPGISPCRQTRFSYVQCLRRKCLEAPDVSNNFPRRPYPKDSPSPAKDPTRNSTEIQDDSRLLRNPPKPPKTSPRPPTISRLPEDPPKT